MVLAQLTCVVRAYAYTDKHVGPRERVGNKGGTLGNRLRAVMAGKK
ncbi:MAG: hypothetical protein NTX17_05815 [Candidatus Eisenbacteria bacterium]|nr:hypothetical protein [Candidatus Eisenbacteria bacterium]